VEDPGKRLTAHYDVLVPLLTELRQVLIKVVNKKEDPAKITEVVDKLEKFRQSIHNLDNIGFILILNQFIIAAFPLSDDPPLGFDPTDLNLPKEKIN